MTTAFESINSDSVSKHDFKIELLLMIGEAMAVAMKYDPSAIVTARNNRLSFLHHHQLITSSLY